MSARNDVDTEMANLLLDDDTLERLLAGRVEPDDAPPGYAEVARVLRAAAALTDPGDLSLEAEHIAAARTLVARGAPGSGGALGKSIQVRSRGSRVKLVGLVVLGTLVGTSGLAVAGVLPDSAQDMLSNVLDRVGISVPPGDHPASSGMENSEVATTTNATGSDKGPEISGNATSTTSTGADKGSAGVNKGAEISGIATSTTSTGVDKGAEISSAASGGVSQAGEHGSDGDSAHGPPVPTPNAGGTNPTDTGSGGHDHAGADIAEERSDGRSAAGSGSGGGSGRGH